MTIAQEAIQLAQDLEFSEIPPNNTPTHALYLEHLAQGMDIVQATQQALRDRELSQYFDFEGE